MNDCQRQRRTGDTVTIDGSYQHNAAYHGASPQRFWHQTRFAHSLELLNTDAGQRILDVGCGSGAFANLIANIGGIEVTAIDANASAITFAKNKYPRPNLHFIQCTVDDLDIEQAPFDAISFLEVVEHIYPHQAEETLNRFHCLLKPGGRLVISTPNMCSAWPLIEKTMDLLHVAPTMAEEQHVTGYTPDTLQKMCESSGFNISGRRTALMVSPWLASISWSLACRVERWEQRMQTTFGCLIIQAFVRR